MLLSAAGLDLILTTLADDPQLRVFASASLIAAVRDGWNSAEPLLELFLEDGDERVSIASLEHLQVLLLRDQIVT